jgi:hypothetical protein
MSNFAQSSPSAPADHVSSIPISELQSMKDDIKELGAMINTLLNNSTIASETINNNNRNGNSGHTPFSRSQMSRSVIFEDDNERTAGSNSIRGSHHYGGLVKLTAPEPFYGKVGTNALQILTFISQMEIYFNAAKINLESPDSLSIALISLRGNALLWYNSIKDRDGSTINSWSQLKVELTKRYQPVAQEQISLTELLDCKFKGSIENYNNDFMNSLLLLPHLNNPTMDSLVMGIYSRGIRGPNTTFVSATVLNAITKKEVSTLNELMSLALLSEQNMKKAQGDSRGAHLPISSNNHSNNRFGNKSFSSPVRFPRPNNNYNNNFTNAKPFNSPQQLNNIGAHDQYYEEEEISGSNDQCDHLNHVGDEHDEDNNGGVTDGPDIDDQAEDHFLNAIKLYDRAKQNNNSITPEEFDRRRRAGACFFCGDVGHMANKCPKKLNAQRPPFPAQFPKRK